jgi:hypothetical protein
MASKQKAQTKPGWHLSFDVNPEVTLTRDRQPCYRATAVARHGDLAYVAELELVNWAEDIAAFFAQARSVFVNGSPEFPDMTGETPAGQAPDEPEAPVEATQEDAPDVDGPVDDADVYEEGDAEYDIDFYPAEDDAEETDSPQPSLW